MHGCLPPMPRLTIKGSICSLDPCSHTKRDHWRFSTMSCACCLRNGWPQESCYVCGQMHIYWCRFLGFTSLWFKALTVALDLEPCLGNSTCNEPADETQALLCDGLWALQHDFCMWCTARQKVIRLLSRSFVLLCCMLSHVCMLLQHTCSHVHSYTCFRLTRVHGSWPMVPWDGINGMVSAPLNLCASMYRAWIPGDWILRAAVKLRCVFVGPVHDCYTVKPANTQLQNTNITTLNNNKCKHAATKKT